MMTVDLVCMRPTVLLTVDIQWFKAYCSWLLTVVWDLSLLTVNTRQSGVRKKKLRHFNRKKSTLLSTINSISNLREFNFFLRVLYLITLVICKQNKLILISKSTVDFLGNPKSLYVCGGSPINDGLCSQRFITWLSTMFQDGASQDYVNCLLESSLATQSTTNKAH
jgi:hypothetical protein